MFKKIILILILDVFSACGSDEETDTVNTNEPCHLNMTKHLNAVFDCSGNKLKDTDVNSKDIAWIKLDYKNSAHKKLNGIGRYGSCTGTLIDTESTNPSVPAYILTNGHCLDELLPGKGVYFDQNISQKNMVFQQYYNFDDKNNRISYPTKIVKYASMDNTDTAIVELEGITLQELQKKGINAYRLSHSLPNLNSVVENIGIPADGVLDVVLRHSICKIHGKASLYEGEYDFKNSYKFQCSIVGGSSGSPVFDYKTKEIIAVVNTTVSDASINQDDCSLQRPCEYSDNNDTRTINKETNYMQSVSFLKKCFTKEGVFNRRQESCILKDLVSL